MFIVLLVLGILSIFCRSNHAIKFFNAKRNVLHFLHVEYLSCALAKIFDFAFTLNTLDRIRNTYLAKMKMLYMIVLHIVYFCQTRKKIAYDASSSQCQGS